MKKYYVILGMIVAAAICVIGVQKGLVNKAEKIGSDKKAEKDEVFSDPKFSNPMENIDKGSKWKMLNQNEFDALENPTECTKAHWDMQGEEMELFVKDHLEKWGANDWREHGTTLYNVGIDGNEETYYSSRHIWYGQRVNEDKDIVDITVDKDSVSGRLHGITMFIPFKEDAKMVFIDIMEKLGMKADESGQIFEEIYKNLKKLGNNRNITYEDKGVKIYIKEDDYTHEMKKDKKYCISIQPSE